MTGLVVIVVLCGAGTFLLRLLPIWRARRRPKKTVTSKRLRAFLQGIGPAAITALLAVSLWPTVTESQGLRQIITTVAALTVIYAVKRWRDGIAGPTLAGALTYGLLTHLLT